MNFLILILFVFLLSCSNQKNTSIENCSDQRYMNKHTRHFLSKFSKKKLDTLIMEDIKTDSIDYVNTLEEFKKSSLKSKVVLNPYYDEYIICAYEHSKFRTKFEELWKDK